MHVIRVISVLEGFLECEIVSTGLEESYFCWLWQKLGQTYVAIRRARGDGNCFFRSFMFSYLVTFMSYHHCGWLAEHLFTFLMPWRCSRVICWMKDWGVFLSSYVDLWFSCRSIC
jgi:hypothetical protein